jgi:hypothetical protein
MATYPIYTGLENVLEGFHSLYRDGYTFSLWNSSTGGAMSIILQYPYEDHEKGVKFFEENATALSQSGNCDMFYLKFHPPLKKNEYIDKKTAVISSTPIRINQLEEMEMSGITGNFSRTDPNGSFKMFEAVQAVKQLPQQIEQVLNDRFTAYDLRLKAIEESEMIDETPPGVMGQIGALLENPQIAQAVPLLIETAIGFIKSLLPKQPVMQENQISGTNPAPEASNVKEVDNDMLNLALDRLNDHCQLDTDLTLLADMAEKNPVMFKMMLQSLRSQKS